LICIEPKNTRLFPYKAEIYVLKSVNPHSSIGKADDLEATIRAFLGGPEFESPLEASIRTSLLT
jgi:hypothetical protein